MLLNALACKQEWGVIHTYRLCSGCRQRIGDMHPTCTTSAFSCKSLCEIGAEEEVKCIRGSGSFGVTNVIALAAANFYSFDSGSSASKVFESRLTDSHIAMAL